MVFGSISHRFLDPSRKVQILCQFWHHFCINFDSFWLHFPIPFRHRFLHRFLKRFCNAFCLHFGSVLVRFWPSKIDLGARVGFGNHFDWFLMDFVSILAPFGFFLAPFGSLLAPFGSIQVVTFTKTVYFTIFSAVSDIQGTACAAGCRLRRRSADPCSQGTGRLRRFANSAWLFLTLQTPKALRGAHLFRRRYRGKSLFWYFFRVFLFWGPLQKSSNIRPLSNPSKISKIGSLDAQARFWSHVRWLLP